LLLVIGALCNLLLKLLNLALEFLKQLFIMLPGWGAPLRSVMNNCETDISFQLGVDR
jgi:hypothetical protein